MSSETVIKVDNLSKCFHIYDAPGDRLKQFVVPRLQRSLGVLPTNYYREFWALRDVSFEVARGETVGIIGKNGSGKSTLLQLICGTLNPTTGSVQTKGRIAALLELGSGFNPEFTGRENVYLNAAVLGLTKEETDARFEEIVSFADIGNFVEQPVKTYSSGMMVRLAFAVQAQVEPDILIVDEALAVGDAKFQAKCFERLRQLKEQGTSILLVTHSSEQIVTHASYALLLDGGRVLERAEPRHVVNRYMDLLFGKERTTHGDPVPPDGGSSVPNGESALRPSLEFSQDLFSTRPGYNKHEYRWGDGTAAILDFSLMAGGEVFPSLLHAGQAVELRLAVRFYNTVVCPILGVTVKTREGVTVYGVNSETLNTGEVRELGTKGSVAQITTKFTCRLAPGDYFLSLGLATRQGEEIIPHDRRYDAIHLQVAPQERFFGLADLDLTMVSESIQA